MSRRPAYPSAAMPARADRRARLRHVADDRLQHVRHVRPARRTGEPGRSAGQVRRDAREGPWVLVLQCARDLAEPDVDLVVGEFGFGPVEVTLRTAPPRVEHLGCDKIAVGLVDVEAVALE